MVTAPSLIPIRYSDPEQEGPALQAVARDVMKVLTPTEEILYIALQGATAMTLKKDAVVITSNRIVLYSPGMLGRMNMLDFQWQDVSDVSMKQGMLSSEFSVETTTGRTERLGKIDKEQAKRAYGLAQQLEQEWREKRRVRTMEEDRAKAGGVYLSGGPLGGASPAGTAAPEDPVEKLGKAKAMLDQGLISEAEYEAIKAKILSSMA